MRLKRFGRKRQPTYRIVVMEHTTRRDGKPVQELGHYNPLTKEIKLDVENIVDRLKTGVQPTKTVKNLLLKVSLNTPLLSILFFCFTISRSLNFVFLTIIF